MKYNYQYIVSVLEGQIRRNEIDGTELNFLNLHKHDFDQEYKEFLDLKNRWDKLEEYFKSLNQSEKI